MAARDVDGRRVELPPGFYDAIGRVTVAASSLEDALRLLYTRMLGSPGAQTVAAGLSFAGLADGAVALQNAMGWHSDGERFHRAIQECRDLYEERNEIIHGSWLILTDFGITVPFRSRRRWSPPAKHTQPRTAEEMRDLAAQMGHAAEQIERLPEN